MSVVGNTIRAERVIARASELTGVDTRMITGPRRKREICEVRFAIMRALRKQEMSLPQIASNLGARDHSTVINGLDRAAGLIAKDKEFAAFVAELEQVAAL